MSGIFFDPVRGVKGYGDDGHCTEDYSIKTWKEPRKVGYAEAPTKRLECNVGTKKLCSYDTTQYGANRMHD